MSLLLKKGILSDKLSVEEAELMLIADDEFDSYYVIKIADVSGDKYFFSIRALVANKDLAKKFNTLRSAKRSVKLIQDFIGDFNCKIEKIKRNNF